MSSLKLNGNMNSSNICLNKNILPPKPLKNMYHKMRSNMKYAVVLDRSNPYLTESESGFSFKKACDMIIDYAIEDYPQVAYDWTGIKQDGESAYSLS